jgi:phosphatidate cytidylyltransferase
VFKRLAGTKDSGATIPGIGGALDLVDSLVLTSPVAMLLLSYTLEWAKRP